MTEAQKRLRDLRDRQSRERQRVAELSLVDELSDEHRSELDNLEKSTRDLERQLRAATCQRRSKSTPLAGVKMHHLMRFSPALAVVPVVHRRAPRCFV